jgi:transposase
MFLKIVRSAQNIDYVYVVEGYRDDTGRIRHKYLFSLGRLDDFLNTESFKKLAKRALIEGKECFDFTKISEGRVLNYGHCLIKKLWDKFQFDEFFKKVGKHKQFNLSQAVFYMTARHMISADSKLGMYESREDFLGFESIGINHLYRALDVLAESKEELEEYLFRKRYNLFNNQVDVVFYDVTTIYLISSGLSPRDNASHCESQNEDILRKYGFSKDGKIGNVQIVLGLLIDSEGFPIGYEIFPGNTFDGKTLIPFLENLKKRFSLKRIIIVADRGINSKINLLKLKELGYGYIVAVRLKSADSQLHKEVFNPEGYVEIKTEEGIFKYKQIKGSFKVKDVTGETKEIMNSVVISYSDKRAEKDRQEREILINKAIKLLQNPSVIEGLNKRGGKKYIKTEGQNRYILDESLIQRDMEFDGYYAVQSSEQLSAEQILSGYHSLWKIEESFRIMKHTIEVRPVYHWTEKRIKGHLVVCFLSFLFMRVLETALNKDVSTERIKEALRSITLTEFNIDGKEYYLKNKMDKVGKSLFKALKVNEPANVIAKEEFRI